MGWDLIIQFLVLTAIVSGGIIFALYRVFISNVDGAKKRLEAEVEAAHARQAELGQKIKEADEELESRRAEMREIEKKLRGEIEEEANKERENIVNKAREEAEEIIGKAQIQCERLVNEAESDISMRVIDEAKTILEKALPNKNLMLLDQDLINEFIDELKKVDMSKVNQSSGEAVIVTARGIQANAKSAVESVLKEKLGGSLAVKESTDPSILSGAMLKFGSMQLDGSLRNALTQESNKLKQNTEKKATV